MTGRLRVAAVCTVYYATSHADAIVTKFLKGMSTDEGFFPPEVRRRLPLHRPDPGERHRPRPRPGARRPRVPQHPPRPDTGRRPSRRRRRAPHRRARRLPVGRARQDPLPPAPVLRADRRRVRPQRPLRTRLQRQAPRLGLHRRPVDVEPRPGASDPPHGRLLPAPGVAQSLARARDRGTHRGSLGRRLRQGRGLRIPHPRGPAVHGRAPVRREIGVRSVQCLEGPEVWRAAERGLWPRELAEAACAAIENKPPGPMEEHAKMPRLFLMEHRDGSRRRPCCCRIRLRLGLRGRASTDGCRRASSTCSPTGPGPTSATCAATSSGSSRRGGAHSARAHPADHRCHRRGDEQPARGHRVVETPYLHIAYEAGDEGRVIRPRGPRPSGACLDRQGPRPAAAVARIRAEVVQ